MINYSKHNIDKKDISSVIRTLKSDLITQGKKIIEFENNLKKYFGTKYCTVVSNGTMALYLLSKALKWKKNDIILCSPISFLAASNAAIFSGATPEFVDIEYETGNLNVNLIEKKIKELNSSNKKIKAIIVTDYGGLPADWKQINKIGKKYKIKLINDNCHAMGAKYFGDKKYAIKYADYIIQSYHAVKNITTGEGGSVLTNDKKISQKIKLLRSHGVVKKNYKSPWNQEMIAFGYNCRITDFQCALGISQLKKLDNLVKKKNKVSNFYLKKLGSTNNLEVPQNIKNKKSAHHLFPIKINFDRLRISKIKFFKIMKNNNINLQVHYIPIYLQPFYKKHFNFNVKELENSKRFYENVMSIPIYSGLTKKNIKKIIKKIKNIISKYSK